ncbi:MAG: hypothetical protein Q7U10_11895 [Thermodesulfovibrionia bacterium]|nr:hypothetical protein [Thermodesulfovibrionia bacterium]
MLKTISLEEARRTIKQLVSDRENNFLRLIERGVYGYPQSPYIPLLKMAGCEFGDIKAMVKKKGLEDTLLALRQAGVYVTFEEFKGRKPIIRDGMELHVYANSFDNPFLNGHYYSETGGSTGAGTRIEHDLEHLSIGAAHEMVTQHAHGALDMPFATWRGVLPDGSGFNDILRQAHSGHITQKWFSPFDPYDFKPPALKYRLSSLLTVLIGRLLGVNLPWPEEVKIEQASLVAHWVADTLRQHGSCLISAPASRALRVCIAAREEGMDFTGAVFKIAGEPITPAKVRGIVNTGARIYTTYGFTEIGRIGMGCSEPLEANDLHLCKSICAMIPYDRLVPGTDIEVPAFNFTSLLPTAPKILLNAESDDYGIIEKRACGCPLGELGFTEHIRRIHSFHKLTGEGVTLVGSDMIHILEEVLPGRFGGSPLDYQLIEEEDRDGFTRVILIISPKVKINDEDEVIDAVLGFMKKSSLMADSARSIWSQAHTLRVRREEPRWTERGKLMSLRVEKRYKGRS